MENSDNIAPVPTQSLPSASPLSSPQQTVQNITIAPAAIISPLSKSLRVLYLAIIPINIAISFIVGLGMPYLTTDYGEIPTTILSYALSLPITAFVLYVYIRQYLVIRKHIKGAFVTYILPPIIVGVVVGGGIIAGALAAIADFGPEVADDAYGFMLGGLAVMVGTAMTLSYFYGLGEMLYIAKQGVLGAWKTVFKVLTILLYVASGVLALFIASIVHSLLDPSTE